MRSFTHFQEPGFVPDARHHPPGNTDLGPGQSCDFKDGKKQFL